MSVLPHRLHVPDDPANGAPVVVLLHGRGADETDLEPVAAYLPPGTLGVFPRAPFPAAPWGYGNGWAWYRFLGGTRPEPSSFAESQSAIGVLLGSLPTLLPVRPGPLVLGGFSQGGTAALAYALAHPGEVRAVLNFSGFLADHPSVRVSPEAVGKTAFYWGHGTADGNISHAVAEAGRAALRGVGADLTAADYSMGHTLSRQELDDAMTWLTGRLAARK